MLPFLRILFYLGLFILTVFGENTEPNSSSKLTRTSYAEGTTYGCSEKFFRHNCWRYCTGDSGDWCYTVDPHYNHCTHDSECYYTTACQGWCAWNSQRGCKKSCHEEVVQPQKETPCRRGKPYWQCQSNSGNHWRSSIAMEAKWMSPDIPNESHNKNFTLTFNKNVVTSTEENIVLPQSAIWYPMGTIQNSHSTFYWTFTIRGIGASTGSIFVGVSDLKKLGPGWQSKGLLYGGNLSDGSRLLIANYGPQFKNNDQVSMLVKFVDAKINIYYFLNGEPLGLAFSVPNNILDGIFPVVKFLGRGSVEIQEIDSVNAPAELEPIKTLAMEGNWTLISLENETFTTKVTMKITEIYDRGSDMSYRLRIHIINKFMGKLIKLSKPSTWYAEILDKTSLTGTTSEMQLETKISEHIDGITNVMLAKEKGELRLQSITGCTNSCISVWKQIAPMQTYVNWNPFEKAT